MPSSLTFAATQGFRDRLLTRNLQPYTVAGVYSGPPVSQIVQELNQSDYSVINSPDELIANDPFADLLYPLNVYGPLGGYDKNINVGGLANTRSNQGPYDYLDAKLPELSEPIQLQIPTKNKYSSSNPLELISINNIQSVPTFKQYADPLNFIPSTYTPYEILIQDNPTGDNGSLSQDSYIVQLGARELRKLLKERIAQSIDEKTIGRLNLLSAIDDPVKAIQIATGQLPFVEKDWTITRPSNILLRSTNFIARLGGFYYPSSVIPGDYWTTDEKNLSAFGQIARAFNGGKDPREGLFGNIFGRILSKPSPSQLFLDNTGAATKNQLYYNLSFNRYSPQYKKSLFNNILDTAKAKINDILDVPNKGGYYVGREENAASTINSPSGELPLNAFGQEIQSPVYGSDRLSKEYEGDLAKFKFGLNGNELYTLPGNIDPPEGGFISGGFVFTSRSNSDPGFKATVGGGRGPQNSTDSPNNFNAQIEPFQTVSQGGTEYNFKEGSILDQTQRILDSVAKAGKNKTYHAGNAINQLSKVFNDGYKEMTKGSQVIGWDYDAKSNKHTPNNVYCRVFTKDTPYYTYNDLQKTDGNIRKFRGSVLDSTYDINIAPIYGKNFSPEGVKKYMFSIENLAWRTSNRPGLTVNDLPACEIGPNKGRIMWFPPYDIKFSETSTPTFKGQDFLGRPEPVYTYTNTKRSGQLSWKIVVDHPSILNVIAQKAIQNNPQSNSILESFFAGCLKYDIYELAKRWPSISVNELFVLQQQVVTSKQNSTPEKMEQVKNEVPKSEDTPEVKVQEKTPPNFDKYIGYSYYFDNNIPENNNSNFDTLYNAYISNQSTYAGTAPTQDKKDATNNFFTSAITYNYEQTNELIKDIQKFFADFTPVEGEENNPSISITLAGSASAVASVDYNKSLSQRRIDSIVNYLQQSTALQEYFRKGYINITGTDAQGEMTTVYPITRDGKKSEKGFNCTELSKNPTLYEKKYSVQALACRRVSITSIKATTPEPKKEVVQSSAENTKPTVEKAKEGYQGETPAAQTKTITTQQEQRDGLSKKVLRKLLSECDYFQEILKSDATFYNSIQKRLKYFHPSFHSTTPEGLNSRLTFLQQCMRPGDTIPVINSKGESEYNNSVNTAFGAPPVLVLRIGDFYHTKIIPQSLQISYEPLLFDLNPEGIGVQPMLANVSMNFEIIGGEGLNGPIDKLQNALSFNFYANTEMYDERADATDNSYKQYDDELWDTIMGNTPLVGVNNTNNGIENPGGNTIGEIQTTIFSNEGTSGETTFQKIMNELHDAGQTYINSLYGKTEEILNNYNLPMYTFFTTNRIYNKGNAFEFTLNQKPMEIFGKTNDYVTFFENLYEKIVDDIEAQDSIIPQGNSIIFDFYVEKFNPRKCIKTIKKNMIKEVRKNKDKVLNYFSQVNDELVEKGLSLTKVMAKLDIVDTNTDGYIKTDQSVQILNLTSTTEVQQGSTSTNTLDELEMDYTSAVSNLNSFNSLFVNSGFFNQSSVIDFDELDSYLKLVVRFQNTSSALELADKRFFIGMYNVLKDSGLSEEFQNNVIAGVENEVVSGLFTGQLLKQSLKYRMEDFDLEYKEEVKFFENQIKKEYEKTYKLWTPFVKDKVRKFLYTTYTDGTTIQKSRINNLYKDGNSNDSTATFNGKNMFK